MRLVVRQFHRRVEMTLQKERSDNLSLEASGRQRERERERETQRRSEDRVAPVDFMVTSTRGYRLETE